MPRTLHRTAALLLLTSLALPACVSWPAQRNERAAPLQELSAAGAADWLAERGHAPLGAHTSVLAGDDWLHTSAPDLLARWDEWWIGLPLWSGLQASSRDALQSALTTP